jgi:hypothetical protein
VPGKGSRTATRIGADGGRLIAGRRSAGRGTRGGRDALAGAAVALLLEIAKVVPMAFGWRIPQLPFGTALLPLFGVPLLFSRWLSELNSVLQDTLAVTMIFVVMRLVLKRSWLALGAGILVLVVVANNGSAVSGSWMDTLNVSMFVLMTVAIYRSGLVAMATALFVSNIVADLPMTSNLSAWWSTPTTLTVGLLIGLACFAYYAARAGQPLFGTIINE